MFKLNPEQRKAVEHVEGPLLVIAGPGSGKTRVITQRIVHLLGHVPGLRPENILALTFTDKAAAEMKARVSAALPDLETAPHISTFHSLCYHVLRQRHFERRLLDKVDTWIFLRRRMEHLGLEYYQKLASPGAFLHDLNEFFSRCQDELVGPAEFSAFVRKVEAAFEQESRELDASERRLKEEELRKLQELARVFRNSHRLIEEAGCSSLGSLIGETVRLWQNEPECLARYRSQFRYVLVDEFQDSNYAQVQLLAHLVALPYNLVAVGDDDQAIYRFRGAAHGALEMFKSTFPGAKIIFLNRNYRSTKRILRAAQVVIARNENEVNKPQLVTGNLEGSPVYLFSSPDYPAEASGVADQVEDLVRKGRPASDIAILYRAHGYRDPVVKELQRREIPFAIRGLSLLSTVIIRDLLAYLRLVHSPHDNISLTRVLLAPRWRFAEALALELRRQAAKRRSSIYDALAAMDQSLFSKELENTNWSELKSALAEWRRMAQRASVTALFDRMSDLLELRFLGESTDGACLEAFRKFLSGWEEKSETRGLREFMEYFDYFLEAGGKIEAPDLTGQAEGIQMMTVHAAKGLEFPVVFILSVAPRRFPSAERKPVIEFPEQLRKGPAPPAQIQLQEERRLFYVAMTRARELLGVSSVMKGKRASVFVDELLSDPVIAARDIQQINVRDAPQKREAAKPCLPRPMRSDGEAQPSLFGAFPHKPATTHPPIAEWASEKLAAPADGKLRLSATSIETYLECPLKFKFSHLLRIPTGPQAALTFGNIMHQAVRQYFKLRKQGQVAFEEIRSFYLGAWKGTGFEDAYQEETYKKSGLGQLESFVGRHNAMTVDAAGVRMEVSFELEMKEVALEGRIDQINPAGPARSRAVELIDYKTGNPRSQKDADKSLQLSVYALAARDQLDLEPRRLVFYNLSNNQPISTVRTAKELEEVRQKIMEVAAEIRRMIFPPAPGFACRYCEFVPICPAHEEEF
jgi:ATP-dependent DNA helicase UvrD/PcrA